MARRTLVGVVIVLAFVGAGAGIALISRDDSSEQSAAAGSTSTAPPTTVAPTTTLPPPETTATTAPTTTPPSTAPPAGPPDACGVDGATIRSALDNGIEGARDGAQVEECRLAAVDASWALVRLVPAAGSSFTPVAVLLQGGAGAWEIVATGDSNVGCGTAPQQVLVDLGIVCSSTGGPA
jgi:hypothetical protein